jgi:hypothetical protein
VQLGINLGPNSLFCVQKLFFRLTRKDVCKNVSNEIRSAQQRDIIGFDALERKKTKITEL